jgi:hypothetical protein
MTFLFLLYLANLGGQMGLFLGASIVTLTELRTLYGVVILKKDQESRDKKC